MYHLSKNYIEKKNLFNAQKRRFIPIAKATGFHAALLVIRDVQTDLDWEVKSAEPSDKRFFKRLMTWNEFKGYVNYLNEISYGGFNDWRVPSKHELRSLINYSNINPAYQKKLFKTVIPHDYWCGAEPFGPRPDCAWFINFNIGSTTAKNQSLQSYGLAVRGKKLPPPQKRFKDNGVAGFLMMLCSYAWQFVKIIGLQKRVKRIYVLIMVVNVVACVVCEKIFALRIISLVIGMIVAEIFIMAFTGVQLFKNFGGNLFSEIKEPLNSTWNLIYAGSSPSAGKFYSLFQVYLFNVFFLHFYGETGVAVFAVLQVAIRICRLHAQVTWQPVPPLFAIEFGDKNVSSMSLIFKTALIRAVIFTGFLQL